VEKQDGRLRAEAKKLGNRKDEKVGKKKKIRR
jgi:hypothetical protein